MMESRRGRRERRFGTSSKVPLHRSKVSPETDLKDPNRVTFVLRIFSSVGPKLLGQWGPILYRQALSLAVKQLHSRYREVG